MTGGSPTGAAPSVVPDFLGIGALKAGSTYVDALLRSHPQLSLPLHQKEVQFFDRHFDRGLDWYAAQFAPDDGRPRGEVSPQYLADAQCPARIHGTNPRVKILLSVRQPVTRAFSQYRHWVQETGYRQDFATFLSEHPGAIERSRYWTLLQRYRRLFPDGQIRVVVLEDIAADPVPVQRDVYAFLGVDPEHRPTLVDDARYASMAPRFPQLYVAGKRVSRALYAHGQGRVVELVRSRSRAVLLHGRARGPAGPTGPAAPAGPPAAVAARLGDELRADADALSAYLARDLTALWGL